MARILFAWQLGAGLGHMLEMLPLAEGLVAQGHQVFAALRNLSRAAPIFGPSGVHLLQAPYRGQGLPVTAHQFSYAHILANVGFGDTEELFALASAWRNLYQLIQPDLIIFNHSPVAQLAARGLPSKRIAIGTGFFNPPDVHPLPLLSSELASRIKMERIVADEAQVLAIANHVLDKWRQPPLDRLGRLYSDLDGSFLNTFAELDHFGPRNGVRYWGPITGSGGQPPDWPKGNGKKIFAYLKPFDALKTLLGVLRDRKDSVLIYPDGIDPATQAEFESSLLHFARDRLDPERVAAECDIGVNNANHGSASTLLRAGKPLLMVPLHSEQRLFGQAVARLGAGEIVDAEISSSEMVEHSLRRILEYPKRVNASQRFAERYAAFDGRVQKREILMSVCQILDEHRRL
jgi:UDP:flavonoid glycosyltransferase YjiC (YdhE family)